MYVCMMERGVLFCCGKPVWTRFAVIDMLILWTVPFNGGGGEEGLLAIVINQFYILDLVTPLPSINVLCVLLKDWCNFCELYCNFNTWLYKLTSFSIYHLIILFQVKFTLVYHFILSKPILEQDNISQFCWWTAFISAIIYSQITSMSLCPLSYFKYIFFFDTQLFYLWKMNVSHT